MRPCAVKDCLNTDLTTLGHRFPKNLETRKLWQAALELENIPLEVLLDRYVVCTHHFKKTDYRNPMSKCLNTTAVPHLSPTKPEAVETSPDSQLSTAVPTVSPPLSPLEESPYKIVILSSESLSKENYVVKVQNNGTVARYLKRRKVNHEDPIPEVATKITVPKDYATKRKQSLKSIKIKTEPPNSSNQLEVDDSIEIELIDEGKVFELDESRQQKHYADLSTQTDETQEDKDLIEIIEKYPQFKEYSKLDLIKDLIEKEKKIKELETKLEKFTVAMSAFKMLMNT